MSIPAEPPPLTIAPEFLVSLDEAANYPQNLLETNTFAATRKVYQERLSRVRDKLCEQDDARTDIYFYDFDSGKGEFTTERIKGYLSLRQKEGVTSASTQTGSASIPSVHVIKRDPVCRAIFVYAPHSRARLKITNRMLTEILSFHEVMPSYLDLLMLFGQSTGPNDLRFGAFRAQTQVKPRSLGPSPAGMLEQMGRSGRHYEVCYNLKTVAEQITPANPKIGTPERSQWSVRQAGVYHKFDVEQGTTFWLFTQGSLELKGRFDEITGPQGRPEDRSYSTVEQSFRSSLAIHAMMMHWASESWRWYMQKLDERIEAETKATVQQTREKGPDRKWYTAQDVQRIQKLLEDVNDAEMHIRSNKEIMDSMRSYYRDLVNDKNAKFDLPCLDHVEVFTKQTQNALYDLQMQMARAKALAQHASARKDLILQYVAAQAAEKQETLTNSTYAVSLAAQNEAIVVRIITVVTLIYLPATFVSTFFSTDAVKYQPQTDNSEDSDPTSYSTVAMNRWLEVALPLTVVTLIVAFTAYRFERNRQVLERAQQEQQHDTCHHV